ncbi:glycosyltransferase [Sulfurovum riftiae]|uniref:Glycosyl transferase n=1 Tax=Sulfurovum riftiae TaxID=1630136 RepID=A0A151CHB9_9BACT|nr:glycosyltransferase [Sulfurovum riftiae]KYJ86926.1 glycosyl transferase [Sulfurovum riftiae]
MDNLSPVVLFVYNRPWHTEQTVEALQKNELASESELFVYSDAAKNEEAQKSVSEVREYLKTIDGFKKVTIVEREKNWGLADSIIDGVTKVVNEYGKIIVLEDDLITSPYFLRFMNESLKMYENNTNVASIHAYIYPIKDLPETFFIKGADCWGWATWKDRWKIFEADGQKLLEELKSRKLEKEADFNGSYEYTQMLKDQIKGKNNSWAVRWYMSAFLKGMLTLYPGKSYIENIGNDESGTHCGTTDIFKNDLTNQYRLKRISIKEDVYAKNRIEIFFKSFKKTFLQKTKQRLLRKFL